MTTEELVARFPEIPADLHGEKVLAQFADRLGPLLLDARKPSACADSHTLENKYYLKLIGPMDIYRYGLAPREKVLAQLKSLLDVHASDPEAFAAGLAEDRA